MEEGNAMNRVRVFFRPKATIQNDCRLWARRIGESYAPDLVVFLAKSGYLFARPIADELGLPLAEVSVSRPDNGMKDAIRRRTPWLPRWLLALALGSGAGYKAHEEHPNREMVVSERLRALELSRFHKLLVVDDSIDTGWSMLRVLEYLKGRAPESEVRVAGYCVIDMSEARVTCDYSRYRNTIVVTATSRFSPEYQGFLDEYSDWRGRAGHAG